MPPRASRPTRRHFVRAGASLAGLALLAGCGRLPWQTPAPARVARIGFLSPGAGGGPFEGNWPLLVQRLRELGYVENQNVVFEWRGGR